MTPLTVEQLRVDVEAGRTDTVLLSLTDLQGRLSGKRLHAPFFVDEVLAHGSEACSYLLAVDVDMNTVGGYAISSWESGYGDVVLKPDLDTLRPVPWQEGTVSVLADVEWEDGSPVAQSPRQILRRQLDRLAERGLRAYAGTELEFLVFRDTYEQAWTSGYRDLTPANLYNVDYSMIGTARIEPLLRRIRLAMAGAGLTVESAKGECNLGQHEIAFRYAEALRTCDDHVLYKTAAKEIAAQEGMALTFMAKYDQREGNSCHIHLSVRGADDDAPVMAGDGEHGFSPLMEHWLAGQLASLRELTLLFAPNINSYKRFAPGSFAPTAVRWGRDNRTCALRVVGRGQSLRVENRVPGGDVNPYFAVAGIVAAGLRGIEEELPLEAAFPGNAYLDDGPRVPETLQEALQLWESSELALAAFGPEVVEHYANTARVELAAFGSAVTDWERYRGFERL
ncbi:glutamine synthetase [Motilibacter rhizosphaerae]|uniref:Glutamine synthetase n=1 Tax=Motilibacter rhizosphaerae TaxID=598652 RepID=A0A4Q7NS71_9ACTN|nr:glutamine synthetase family protein [Motilibacter rhizosphaerae]RZS89937.1 glutamine synthetase [Motilibacter rhizosphaerae]